MNIKYLLLLFGILLIPSKTLSQNIYSGILEGCNTKRFALESKKETAKKNKSELIDFLTSHLEPQIQNKLRGELKFQIIVYTNGTSCLLSYENNSNTATDKLNINKLKELIDNELIWKNEIENVSALVVLKFKRNKVLLKRIGMDGRMGPHELKE